MVQGRTKRRLSLSPEEARLVLEQARDKKPGMIASMDNIVFGSLSIFTPLTAGTSWSNIHKIVFTGSKRGVGYPENADMFSINDDGTNLNSIFAFNTITSISANPKTNEIAIMGYAMGSEGDTSILTVLNKSSGQTKMLSKQLLGASYSPPYWSRDNKYVCFDAYGWTKEWGKKIKFTLMHFEYFLICLMRSQVPMLAKACICFLWALSIYRDCHILLTHIDFFPTLHSTSREPSSN